MVGPSRRTRLLRSVIGQFLAFGIGVGLMLVLLGMILGLEAGAVSLTLTFLRSAFW